ncbi:MAG: hypothetical protein ACQETI_07595 [Halobacteriota archaeon]
MALRNPSEIVGFDADGAREAVEDVLVGPLHSLIEYDRRQFNPLYVDDETLDRYPTEVAMRNHFEMIHTYVHIDFTEMNLVTNQLFPVANRVKYIVTGLDEFTLLRVYVEDEGLVISVGKDEAVDPILDALDPFLTASVERADDGSDDH